MRRDEKRPWATGKCVFGVNGYRFGGSERVALPRRLVSLVARGSSPSQLRTNGPHENQLPATNALRLYGSQRTNGRRRAWHESVTTQVGRPSQAKQLRREPRGTGLTIPAAPPTLLAVTCLVPRPNHSHGSVSRRVNSPHRKFSSKLGDRGFHAGSIRIRHSTRTEMGEP